MKIKSLDEFIRESKSCDDDDPIREVSGYDFADRIAKMKKGEYQEDVMSHYPFVEYDADGEDMPLMVELRRQIKELADAGKKDSRED